MTEIETSLGIVGFFDILGYSSFLENNTPEEAARIVIQTLLDLPNCLGTYHEELLAGRSMKDVRGTLKKIESLVFSDTVLLTLAYPTGADIEIKNRHWGLFLAHSILLYRHLFDAGLPVRGALAFGSYLVHKACFAGRSIIEAYKLAGQLDFAGVVFAESAASEVANLRTAETHPWFNNLSLRYRVPLKDEKDANLLTLSPSLVRVPKQKLPQDLRQYVANTFWAHNKDLPPKVIRKLENTEMYFRFFKMKVPPLFE